MTRRDSRPLKGALLVLLLVAAYGCATRKPPPVPSPTGKTTQLPASYYNTYYSTQKARTLGETYSENLDHILEQLTQSSIGKLQFANAVVSLSVGFFTHAASQPPDERYLEAIIGMPDILDEEKDFSTLVGQIFSDYGRELLSTMTQDEAIARETKIVLKRSTKTGDSAQKLKEAKPSTWMAILTGSAISERSIWVRSRRRSSQAAFNRRMAWFTTNLPVS